MPERRRRFSPQFRAEAVQLVIETGKPVAEVARDPGVVAQTLGTWVKRGAMPTLCLGDAVPIERARMSDLGEETAATDGERVLKRRPRTSSPGRRDSEMR
jgi:hypothetical protein